MREVRGLSGGVNNVVRCLVLSDRGHPCPCPNDGTAFPHAMRIALNYPHRNRLRPAYVDWHEVC